MGGRKSALDLVAVLCSPGMYGAGRPGLEVHSAAALPPKRGAESGAASLCSGDLLPHPVAVGPGPWSADFYGHALGAAAGHFAPGDYDRCGHSAGAFVRKTGGACGAAGYA